MAIYYQKRRHYKYTLTHSCELQIDFAPKTAIQTPFISLSQTGILRLAPHYSWDGASGPMPDLPSVMRGALVHDALYQLMRVGLLDAQQYRAQADRLLLQMCLADGMNGWLARWVYFCVRRYGGRFAQAEVRILNENPHTP